MKRTALLTGATGFVGSRVADRLAADGWSVEAIVRDLSTPAAIALRRQGVVCHPYDGSAASVATAIDSCRPGVTVHLASLFLATHRPDQISDMFQANLLFGAQLADAVCSLLPPEDRRLLNTGTSWQHYGGAEYSPVNLYAASKQAFEAVLRFYVEARGLAVVSLKLFDNYGPSDPRKKLFTLLQSLEDATEPLDMSGGEQQLDLLYIDDVVDAFRIAAQRLLDPAAAGHEQFAVSSGESISLREVVATYERVTGKSLRINWGGRPYREREVLVPWGAGVRLPGWSPRVSLEEGIQRVKLQPSEA